MGGGVHVIIDTTVGIVLFETWMPGFLGNDSNWDDTEVLQP